MRAALGHGEGGHGVAREVGVGVPPAEDLALGGLGLGRCRRGDVDRRAVKLRLTVHGLALGVVRDVVGDAVEFELEDVGLLRVKMARWHTSLCVYILLRDLVPIRPYDASRISTIPQVCRDPPTN